LFYNLQNNFNFQSRFMDMNTKSSTDVKLQPTSIQFGLVANTPGYLAFGIAAAGQVNGTGADIIMSSSDPVTSSVSTIDMNIRAKNLPAGTSFCFFPLLARF
jgi:hypothetical protein